MNASNEGTHLFLSYSRSHVDLVTDVARRLQQRGVSVILDVLDDEMPGRRFLEVIEGGIRKASTVAVFIGSGGLGRFQRLEVNLAIILSAKRGVRVIPVLLPGAGHVSELELFLECFSWIDLRGGVTVEQIDRLARLCPAGPRAAPAIAAATGDHSLPALLQRAQRRLIISGHTLDKFTRDVHVQEALLGLVRRDKQITILQLNPESPYAIAHRPFHELESTSSADDQYSHTVEFFLNVFRDINPPQRDALDVSFTNYMPRFRTVIIDESVYVYLYMYGADVADTPDLRLEPSDDADDLIRRRILYSTLSKIYAPESIPLIRCGQVFSRWRDKHISKWSSWTTAERLRHKLTHEFYVTHARVFHDRFGTQLEADVQAHLDHTKGHTLVLGCGSGKEVEYVARRRPNDYVCGVDFSHVAIGLARQRCGTRDRLMLGNFYDLDLSEPLGDRRFDSVVANAAFVHLQQRDDIDSLLLKIWRRLTDGGVLFLRCLFKEQEGQALPEEIDQSDSRSDRWSSRRWFVYYSRTELARRCQDAGFEVDHKATETIARSGGLRPRIALTNGIPHVEYKGVFWSCVLARKRGSPPTRSAS